MPSIVRRRRDMRKRANALRIRRLLAGFAVLAGAFAVLMAAGCNNTTNPKPKTNAYSIDATDIINGGKSEIFSIPAKPKAGDLVTLIVEPEPGKAIEILTIMYGGALIAYEQLDIRPNGIARYTFIMPKGPVRVSASFIDLNKYRIIIGHTSNGTLQSSPEGYQYEQYPVDLFSDAAKDFKLNPASLLITDEYEETVILHTVTPTGFIFTMPDMDVRVKGEFVPASTVLFNINARDVDGGIINVPVSAPAEYPVKVRLIPNPTYDYKAGSLRITGVANEDIKFDDKLTAEFIMPENAVTVNAVFEKMPAFAINTSIKGQEKQGTFVSTVKGMAVSETTAGAEVTLRLTVTTPASHRYKAGSFSLQGANAIMTLNNREWVFTMPAANVTASVEIEAGATPPEPHFAITADSGIRGGSLSFAADTFVAGQGAESGDTVTITAAPEGTAWELSPTTVMPVVAKTDGSTLKVARVAGELDKWNFRMPAEKVTVTYQFTEVMIAINATPTPVIGGVVEVTGINEDKKAKLGDIITITSIPTNEEFIPQEPTAYGYEFTPAGTGANGAVKWSFTVVEVPISRTINVLVPFYQKTYKLERGDVTGGEVKITVANPPMIDGAAAKGATVTIAGKANEGYILADAIVTITPAGAVSEIGRPSADKWTFLMPNVPITVSIRFKSFKEAGGKVIYSNGKFDEDVGSVSLAGFNDPQHTFAGNLGMVDLYADITGGRSDHTKAIRLYNGTGGGEQVGFTLKAAAPFDLGGTGALSFWAKKKNTIEANFAISVVGFGDTTSNTVFYYGEENGGNENWLDGKNWKRYIVPVPVPKTNMPTTNVFFLKLSLEAETVDHPAYEMWIDDIEYLPASMVKMENIRLPSSLSNSLPSSGSQSALDMINEERNGYSINYTTYGLSPPATATLFSKFNVNLFANYDLLNWIPANEFTVGVTGSAATVNGINVTPVTPGESFSLSLSYKGVVSNGMSVNILKDTELMLQSCQANVPTEVNGVINKFEMNGVWSGFTDNQDLTVQGRKSINAIWKPGINDAGFADALGVKYCFLGLRFTNGAPSNPTLSTFSKITFKVRVPSFRVAPRQRCEFYLRSNGNWYEYTDGFNHNYNASVDIDITLAPTKFVAPTKAGISPLGAGTINFNNVDAFAIGIVRDEETGGEDCAIFFADVMAVK